MVVSQVEWQGQEACHSCCFNVVDCSVLAHAYCIVVTAYNVSSRALQQCLCMCSCSELRLKDIERVQKHLDGVKALEKRGLSKEQKEELVICQKVLDWLQSGKDVR